MRLINNKIQNKIYKMNNYKFSMAIKHSNIYDYIFCLNFWTNFLLFNSP